MTDHPRLMNGILHPDDGTVSWISDYWIELTNDAMDGMDDMDDMDDGNEGGY